VQERNAQFQAVGAGIQLGPNALRLLDRLGLLGKLQAYSCPVRSVLIRGLDDGQLITQINQDVLEQRYGYASIAIHRVDLQQVLVDAAMQEPLIDVQLGSRSELSHLDSQEQWLGIIGADGLWSSTRPFVAGLVDNTALEQPNYTGKIALRALAPMTQASTLKDVGLWLGANRHVVHYPVRSGSYLNIIAMARLPEAQALSWAQSDDNSWNRSIPREKALALFDGSHHSLMDVLRSARSFDYWQLFDRPALTQFHRDRVCLVGDAAHPMQAHLAQGASLAIEDAVVLGGCIERAKSIEAAFEQFSALRVARCTQAQNKAKQYGNIYQAGGLTAIGRNLFLKSPFAKANSAGMDWLYRGIDDSLLPSVLQKTRPP
jgi:salicylate hydroxylase